MDAFPEGLEPVTDLAPAAWVRDALRDWPRSRPFEVRDLVPPVFDAYARILHETRREDHDGMHTGTWAKRASELSRELGAETTWWQMLGRSMPYEGERDEWTPEEGGLSEREVRALVSLLDSVKTGPAACWFALWSGFGFLSRGGSAYLVREPRTLRERWAIRAIRRADRRADRESERALARFPQFSLLGGGRSYLLMAGTVSDTTRFTSGPWFQSPTLWWAADRSWFFHTEIDGQSTYLGGAHELVDRLVGEQILECFEVEAGSLAAL